MKRLWLILPLLAACGGASHPYVATTSPSAVASSDAPPPSRIVLQSDASAPATTNAFTVTAGAWRVNYNYDCHGGEDGIGLMITVTGDGPATSMTPLTSSGLAEMGEYDLMGAGHYELEVDSHCAWSVVVLTG